MVEEQKRYAYHDASRHSMVSERHQGPPGPSYIPATTAALEGHRARLYLL